MGAEDMLAGPPSQPWSRMATHDEVRASLGLSACRPFLTPAVRKLAAYVPVTPKSLADGEDLLTQVEEMFDRYRRPWAYPDHPRWPTFVVLPAMSAAQEALAEGARRVRAAWATLRWGDGRCTDGSRVHDFDGHDRCPACGIEGLRS